MINLNIKVTDFKKCDLILKSFGIVRVDPYDHENDKHVIGLYLSNEEDNELSYVTTTQRSIWESWKTKDETINDTDLEEWLEKHRGKIAMNKLNLL